MRVNNGDYDAKQVINTENLEVITQYDEIELEDWMQDPLHYDPNKQIVQEQSCLIMLKSTY